MTEEIKFLGQHADVGLIDNAQMCFETSYDADLGYRMRAAKTPEGVSLKFLAKGFPGLLTTLKLTDASTSGTTGFIRHDTDGMLYGGKISVATLNSFLTDGPLLDAAVESLNSLQGDITLLNGNYINVDASAPNITLTLQDMSAALEAGGAWELDVTDLSGVLVDAQHAGWIGSTPIVITGLTDEDVLQYDSAAGAWINAEGGGSSYWARSSATTPAILTPVTTTDVLTVGSGTLSHLALSFSGAPTSGLYYHEYASDFWLVNEGHQSLAFNYDASTVPYPVEMRCDGALTISSVYASGSGDSYPQLTLSAYSSAADSSYSPYVLITAETPNDNSPAIQILSLGSYSAGTATPTVGIYARTLGSGTATLSLSAMSTHASGTGRILIGGSYGEDSYYVDLIRFYAQSKTGGAGGSIDLYTQDDTAQWTTFSSIYGSVAIIPALNLAGSTERNVTTVTAASSAATIPAALNDSKLDCNDQASIAVTLTEPTSGKRVKQTIKIIQGSTTATTTFTWATSGSATIKWLNGTAETIDDTLDSETFLFALWDDDTWYLSTLGSF